MKKLVVLTAFLFGFVSAEAAKKIEGYIHYNDSRKEKVTFLIPFGFLSSEPTYANVQRQIRYLVGKSKVVLKADDVKEISFSLKGKEIRMRSVYDNLQQGWGNNVGSMIFLKLEIDGPVRLYTYYSTSSSPGMVTSTGMMTGGGTYTSERFVVQRDDGELVRPRSLYFRKDMAEFFADCIELVKKIEDRILVKSDLEIIVKEYNTKCL